MKRMLITGLLTAVTSFLFAQDIDKIINAKEVERIEKVLSADDMEGRKVFTPAIDRAAAFIAHEFKTIGLKPADGASGYLQPFSLIRSKPISTSGMINGEALEAKDIVVVTPDSVVKTDMSSGYEKAAIRAGENLFSEASKYTQSGKNYIVLVDTSFSKNFPRLSSLKRQVFSADKTVIFVMTAAHPTSLTIEMHQEITPGKLANVVGILPGKSKKNEYVIFSGHYDHLGIGRPVNGDSIYNGANDDAAGTTAVIMLAKYFKAKGDNERTLVFAAFTGEESGGFGSHYFSHRFDPATVMAMFNIEMIGTESKWGKNSAYITGYEKTDMGKILEKNLEGTGFTFYPDPYTTQNLFYRSDNATLARQGVPAHTISTSKMDNEPNYHKVSDEIQTLDMNNMAMIIKSIALSSSSIISGKDTPTRVNTDDLR
ncbi:MAG TPA: M28 family peptidase [Chitinophagaceae bacterium]|jgi:hypothetical protein